MLRRSAAVAGLLVALASAACGGGDDAARPAATPGLEGALAAPVRLQGRYAFGGRPRAVDVRVAPVHVVDPYPDAPAPAARGRRWVGVQLAFVDSGRDPFPHRWAAFSAVDDDGAGVPPGPLLSPLRRRYADRPRRGQPVTRMVAFQVPDGRRLREVGMRSIVALWPFRATWRLAG